MKFHPTVSYRQSLKDRTNTETGTVPRPAAYDLKIAAVFPNTYHVGMSSLGFQWIIDLAVQQGQVLCERVFLPDACHLDELNRTGEQILTCETQSHLSDFDVLAFSLQFEIDYANVVKIMQVSKIPARGSDRNDNHPIVIAGGPCATFNPEPMSDFVDIFVVGDAEPVLPGLIDLLKNTAGSSRNERLLLASQLESVYVPIYPRKVKRAVCSAPGGAVSSIEAEDSEFGRTRLVEISRGCGRRCRFCVAGHIGRPVRYMHLEEYPDNEKLGLVGAAVLDHPSALEYCNRISMQGGIYTMSSIRLETLDDYTCRMLKSTGTRTVTIAPEAGSERLRKVLNKDVCTDKILQVAETVYRNGIPKLRMYFMIGLPTESDNDIHSIVDLVQKVAQTCPDLTLGISASSFVPKPFTPFQWHPMESPQILKRRYSMLRDGLGRIRKLEFSGESPRLAFIQGLLARGDSSLSNMIEQAAADSDYLSAIRQTQVEVGRFIYREMSFDESLPWDRIDANIDKEYLWKEYQLALNATASGPCIIGKCRACGACG